jgi:hypothetical protein
MKMKVVTVTAMTGLALVLGGTSADAAGGVRFAKVYYDSPGSDTGSNRNVNAEWFTLTNAGSQGRSLAGWTVRDPEGHVYRFPSGYRLGAGKTVKVHTGKGTSTTLERYWGQNYYVWNNSGDKAILKNASGSKIDVCSWSSIGSGSTGC